MPDFVNGLRLAQLFYEEAARPIPTRPSPASMSFLVGPVSQLVEGNHLTMQTPLCRALRRLYEQRQTR